MIIGADLEAARFVRIDIGNSAKWMRAGRSAAGGALRLPTLWSALPEPAQPQFESAKLRAADTGVETGIADPVAF